MSSETKKRRARRNYDLGYKRKVVQEYLSGTSSAQEIASREGLEVGQIYKWRVQLGEHARADRLDQIQADDPSLSMDQARKIRELEEELAATQKKLAQLSIENELLGDLVKKTDPSSPFARKSSGYAEIKIALGRSKGRAK
jgi:transposase-like protein